MKKEKQKSFNTKLLSRMALLFMILLLLLFTQCNLKTKEERISRTLSGNKKLVWHIHRNEWNKYQNRLDPTGYACEFYKNGYGYYIIPIQLIESRGVKLVSKDSTWRMIDSVRIKFNFDTFKILSYNDTLFKLQAREDTFYLIKEPNQKQSFYDYERYTFDNINFFLHKR